MLFLKEYSAVIDSTTNSVIFQIPEHMQCKQTLSNPPVTPSVYNNNYTQKVLHDNNVHTVNNGLSKHDRSRHSSSRKCNINVNKNSVFVNKSINSSDV